MKGWKINQEELCLYAWLNLYIICLYTSSGVNFFYGLTNKKCRKEYFELLRVLVLSERMLHQLPHLELDLECLEVTVFFFYFPWIMVKRKCDALRYLHLEFDKCSSLSWIPLVCGWKLVCGGQTNYLRHSINVSDLFLRENILIWAFHYNYSSIWRYLSLRT